MERIESYADLVSVIRDAMASKGVTQKELSEVVGCHQPQIARMLKDDHSPSISNIFLICDYLKIQIGAVTIQ